jgi:hypothetical protein
MRSSGARDGAYEHQRSQTAQSTAINGNQWQSTANNSNQRQSTAINGNQRPRTWLRIDNSASASAERSRPTMRSRMTRDEHGGARAVPGTRGGLGPV